MSRGSSSLYPLPAGHVPISARLECGPMMPRVPPNNPQAALAMLPCQKALEYKLWKFRAMPAAQLMTLWLQDAALDQWMNHYGATFVPQSDAQQGDEFVRFWIAGLQRYEAEVVALFNSAAERAEAAWTSFHAQPNREQYEIDLFIYNSNFELATRVQRLLVVYFQVRVRQVIAEHTLAPLLSTSNPAEALLLMLTRFGDAVAAPQLAV
jgi:hypothetical protein